MGIVEIEAELQDFHAMLERRARAAQRVEVIAAVNVDDLLKLTDIVLRLHHEVSSMSRGESPFGEPCDSND